MGMAIDKDYAPERRVTMRGKILALGIIGMTVVFSIFLEKFGSPERLRLIPWLLLGSIVVAYVVANLFYKRPVRRDPGA